MTGSRCFGRSLAAAVGMVFLLGSVPARSGEEGALDLGLAKPLAADAVHGKARASVTPVQGELHFAFEVDALTPDYEENWRFDAAAVDLRLPAPVALPADTDLLTFFVDVPYDRDNPGDAPRFKFLLLDAQNREWLLSIRLLRSYSSLVYTQGFKRAESYRLGINELGRTDRWILQALKPTPNGQYDAPALPVRLNGFRLIGTRTGKAAFALRSLRAAGRGQAPDPYWALYTERLFADRLNTRSLDRFGWGPDEPGPFLTATDLGLGAGNYEVSWEILDASGWTRLAGGVQDWTVAKPQDDHLSLALLPNGTYRARVYVRGKKAKTGTEWAGQYVVLRNSRGAPLADPTLASPRLTVTSDNPGGAVFESGKPVKLTVAHTDPRAAGTLAWTVESSDRVHSRSGSGSAGQPIVLDLTAEAARYGAVWLQVQWRDGETVRDSLRRIVGVANPAPNYPDAAVAAKAKPGSKMDDAFVGRFRRTKGDWNEGATSIVGKAKETLGQYGPWLEDAKTIGYNIVEVSAPWHELNPLPGVFLFDYLDPLVDKAAAAGFKVVVRVHPNNGLVPSWVARELQTDAGGRVHGIWAGGSNLIYSPASETLNRVQAEFLSRLAARYRQRPEVIGYTLSNVFFDHSFIDAPHLGQVMDYSDAMRRAFVAWLREKTPSLAALSARHGRNYIGWEAVSLPAIATRFDADGLLEPRVDPLFADFAAFKKHAIEAFRVRGIEAVRRGDPAAMVGPYSDNARLFLEGYYEKNNILVAQGSMENPLPPLPWGYPVRCEPHAKVSRSPRVVDIGISNLMFYRPGFNGLFNYWKPEWALATVTPDIRAAEERLAKWFAVLDRIAGARFAGEELRPAGLCVTSLETLLLEWQHMHTARFDDYVKLYHFRARNERATVESLTTAAIGDDTFARYRYVYLPYASDTLTPAMAERLVRYVEGGGKLVVEATSGQWRTDKVDADSRGALWKALGLPKLAAAPLATEGAATDTLSPVAGELLDGLPLAFRVRPWSPPIETQPEPWIDTASRAFFRRFSVSGDAAWPAGAKGVAADAAGRPVAWRVSKGKGEILCFAGVLDWSATPGLARRLEQWAKNEPFTTELPKDPLLLSAPLEKDGRWYALGRRYIDHVAIATIKTGKPVAGIDDAVELSVTLAPSADGRYRVTELLGGRDLGLHDAASLRTVGVKIPLCPGEGFLLEAIRQ